MNDATILFLAANPLSSGRLALDEEVRDIEARIQRPTCSVPLTLRTCWAVRPSDLLTALNEERPAIVHFSGHGSGASGLVLHDREGQEKMVSGRALRRLFETHRDYVRIVVLNACYSLQQARVIRNVIDCVVGMRGSIGDETARTFSAAF